MKLNIKYYRTDKIWLVRWTTEKKFQLSFSNQDDAENLCIQLNQDQNDDGKEKDFYVLEVLLIGNEYAERMINDKKHRDNLRNIY
jgi:hypothetical protein